MTPFFVPDNFQVYLQTERRYSQHTVDAYLLDVRQFMEFAGINTEEGLKEVDYQLIRSWIVHLHEANYDNKSINRKLATLRTFFKFQLKSGKIEKNPAVKVTGPKQQKKLPAFAKQSDLEPESLDVLFTDDFGGVRDRLMLEMFYQTGIRLSELINLTEENVGPAAIKVLGKRNKERLIPISENLTKLINQFKLLKNSNLFKNKELFCLNNGKKVYPKFVYGKINYYLSLATSLDVKSPHVLRHTFATHMLNNGAGLETLKDILGHSSLAATQVYTHNSFAQLTHIYSSAHPRGHKNQ
ncbi:MAG: integrase [Crocinitomicaceae bacterium]|jgi:integrase/recombinase XerC|nr:integrase [Crocinitomicaceae bacterium]